MGALAELGRVVVAHGHGAEAGHQVLAAGQERARAAAKSPRLLRPQPGGERVPGCTLRGDGESVDIVAKVAR
eukprot:11205905-Lingulodinium_polyedra.AAC.1